MIKKFQIHPKVKKLILRGTKDFQIHHKLDKIFQIYPKLLKTNPNGKNMFQINPKYTFKAPIILRRIKMFQIPLKIEQDVRNFS